MASSSLLFKFGVDDALDAVAGHLGGGLWGILVAPIFDTEKGILHNFNLLAFQSFVRKFQGSMAIVACRAALCGPLLLGLINLGSL